MAHSAADQFTSDLPAGAVPIVRPPQTDTQDQEYLERLEATLASTEQSLEQLRQADRQQTAGERPRTSLAVSIVIPVYNERDTIAEVITRVQRIGIHHEILVVDDFSLDGTRDVLLTLAKQGHIRLLLHGYNRGKGAALRTAFTEAQGDVILIQDADLEYDPQDYPLLLRPLELGTADVVYGSRFLANVRQDPSRWHRLGNWLLTKLSNLLTRQNLTDMETCYKVFRRELLDQFTLEQDRFGFEPEFTAKLSRAGARIAEVPIRYRCRSYDEGKKIGVRDGFNALWCIAKYGW